MKLVRPLAVTDAVLTSSDAQETVSAWSNVTTYALNEYVGGATGTTIAVYRSLQAANLNHAPASSPTWWAFKSTTYAAYAGGTTYAQGDRVIVVSTNVHRIYESVQGANTGNAVSDPAWWLDIGATNRWAMFDGVVNAQTERQDNLNVTLLASGRVDSVVLLNISAASAHITMTDTIDGVVFDQMYALVSNSGIADWYSYFFEPIIRIADLVVTSMPPYANATIQVVMNDTGATVKCGECVLGLSRQVGETQYGASVGIQDYSVKTTDAFGNFTVTERAFSKQGSFTVWIDNGLVDELQTLLAGYRATPIVYVGSDSFAATAVFGFYKQFAVEIAYTEKSIVTIDIEGLT